MNAPAQTSPGDFAASIGSLGSAPAPVAAPAPAAPAAGVPTGGLPHPGLVATPPAVATPPQQQQVALPAAEPANTNAIEQPLEQPLQPAVAETPVEEAAPDPFAEEMHGLTLGEIVAQMREGTLPETVLQNLKVTVKVNGNELQVPLREAANGYQRLTDYTQAKQALAQQAAQVENVKGKLQSLFAGWDKPEGFEQSINNLGLNGHVNAMVTREWGTPEQPNLQAFFTSLREMGAFPIFRAAANAYANDYSRRVQQYNPFAEQYAERIAATADPVARQRLQQEAARLDQQANELYAQHEREMDQTWDQRVAAKQEATKFRREAAARERAALLAQQQLVPVEQPQNGADVHQQLVTMREANFKKLGIVFTKPTEQRVALQYFDENMRSLLYVAKENGYQETIDSIVQKAAQETLLSLQLDPKMKAALATALTQKPAPVTPPAAPQILPPRAGGAPITTAAKGGNGGSPLDFEALFRR